jgi:hypothetical protein
LSLRGQGLPKNNRLSILLDSFSNNKLKDQQYAELKNIIYAIQNRGFIFEERSRDYNHSLLYIDSALKIWVRLADTLNEANLRKFRGMVLGHLNRFEEGKMEISRAIYLFGLRNRKNGIAVSQFDMSKVYELEGKIDSAILYVQWARAFWVTEGDSSRIMDNDLQLFNLYIKLPDLKRAQILQTEAEKLIIHSAQPAISRIDFYFLSQRLFEKLANKELQSKYNKKYKNLAKKENQNSQFI